MADIDIAKRVEREAQRLQLSDIELAALTGLSLPTIAALRRKGQSPVTTRARRSVVSFLERARAVRSRMELTLPPAA